jgi:hypothetical protein
MVRIYFTISWPETSKLSANRAYWSSALDRLVHVASPQTLEGFGVRLLCLPNQRLETTLSFTGEADLIRRVQDTVTAYDGSDGVRVTVGTSGAADRLRIALPQAAAIQPSHEELNAGEGGAARIYMRTDMLPLIDTLRQIARSGQVAFAFVSAARRFAPDRETLRRLHHNLHALEDIAGLPRRVYEDQLEIVQRWQVARFLLDECCVVDPGLGGTAQILSALDDAMRQTIYSQYGSKPALIRISAARSAKLFDLRHVDDELPVQVSSRPLHEIAGKVASTEDLMERLRLAWVATSQAAAMKHDIDQALVKQQGSETGASAGRPYVFISYARVDERRMLEIAMALKAIGIDVWVDREISAGSAWDEELERRIRASACFLAIITREYMQSKICIREIKFADGLGKPLVPLLESGVMLGSGLSLMLSSQQQFGLDDPRIIARVQDLVRQGAS